METTFKNISTGENKRVRLIPKNDGSLTHGQLDASIVADNSGLAFCLSPTSSLSCAWRTPSSAEVYTLLDSQSGSLSVNSGVTVPFDMDLWQPDVNELAMALDNIQSLRSSFYLFQGTDGINPGTVIRDGTGYIGTVDCTQYVPALKAAMIANPEMATTDYYVSYLIYPKGPVANLSSEWSSIIQALDTHYGSPSEQVKIDLYMIPLFRTTTAGEDVVIPVYYVYLETYSQGRVGRVSRFGGVVETCVLTSDKYRPMVTISHRTDDDFAWTPVEYADNQLTSAMLLGQGTLTGIYTGLGDILKG